MARSRRGMIHGGVRWKTAMCSTTGAISGTNWIAEAPVPMTATRRPRRSRSWRQVAEWNTSPSKSVEAGHVRERRVGEGAGAQDDRVGGPGALARGHGPALVVVGPAGLGDLVVVPGEPVDAVLRPTPAAGRRGSPAGPRTTGSSPGSARRRTSRGGWARRTRSPGRSCPARCRPRRRGARRSGSPRRRPGAGGWRCRARRSRSRRWRRTGAGRPRRCRRRWRDGRSRWSCSGSFRWYGDVPSRPESMVRAGTIGQ